MNKENNKAIQYFTDEQLGRSRQLREPRLTQSNKTKSKLISLKVPEDLLELFKTQCDLRGLKYQSQIKGLMPEWLKDSNKQ